MGPIFREAGIDAVGYGKDAGYPIGTPSNYGQQKYLVGSFSHYDRIFPHIVIKRSTQAWRFGRQSADFTQVTYKPDDTDMVYGFEDYFDRIPVTSFLLIRDDQILYERYQYARRESDWFTSWSMAKTVVAMLVGIAERDRLIDIHKAAGHYLPTLAATSLAEVPVKAFLQMVSGNQFDERNYGPPEFDITRLSLMLRGTPRKNNREEVLQEFAKSGDSPAAPYTKFNYASFDTLVLGTILAKVIGTSLSSYLEENIWKRIGTESDAAWTIDVFGEELAHCCLNATLRDYGRLGRLLAHGGDWGGVEVIPQAWLRDATKLEAAPHPLAPGKHHNPSRPFGYGYQLHVLPWKGPAFSLRGIHGQAIYVHPASKLVLVQTAVFPTPLHEKYAREGIRLWLSLVDAFS